MAHRREPIKHTCPDIDKAIKKILDANKLCGYKSSETIEELSTRLDDIEWLIRNIESDLEKLREANSILREWGIDEASRVDELERELKTLEA